VTLAAHHVTFEVWSFLALILDSVAIAAQTLVGEALGQGNQNWAHRLAWRTVGWSVLVGAGTGLALFVVRSPLAQLFGDDPDVISLTTRLLIAAALLQPLAGAAFGLDGVFIGASDLGFIATAMVGAAACFVGACGLIAATGAGPEWLWAAIGAFLVARVLPLLVRMRGRAWMAQSAPAAPHSA